MIDRREAVGARRCRDADVLALEVLGVVERPRIAEADRGVEAQFRRDPLAEDERWRHAVHGRLDPSRALEAVDALDLDEETDAIGGPPDRLGDEPPIHVRGPRQIEAGDVAGWQGRLDSMKGADGRDADEEQGRRPGRPAPEEERAGARERCEPRRPGHVRTRPGGEAHAGGERDRDGSERHRAPWHGRPVSG